MKGKTFTLAIAALVAMFAMGMSHAAQPSAGCNSGEVTPGTTPLGIGIDQTGDPTSGAGGLKVCNTGSTIPAPLKGAATVSGDANTQSGFVDVDGDSDNAGAPCTDGYFRIAGDANGPRFYESPNGGWTVTSPAEDPQTFVTNTVNNCAGPLPAP